MDLKQTHTVSVQFEAIPLLTYACACTARLCLVVSLLSIELAWSNKQITVLDELANLFYRIENLDQYDCDQTVLMTLNH